MVATYLTRDRDPTRVAGLILAFIAVGLALGSCGSASPTECPESRRIDLSEVDPDDGGLPFRYPLDVVEKPPHDADFCEHSSSPGGMFHAAEDYWRPAGTAVYAMADGEVSFSGTMGGYGWLVIIDHPEMNLYSLYGHLSPSRWTVDTGPINKGDLIGYLGDEWENGGSRQEPLVAHLHLGVRAGQRTEYPGKGEWRWMAGWIKLCPAELGWLQPSAVITAQSIPQDGFSGPAAGFLERWWTELLLVGSMLAGTVWWTVVGIRKHQPLLLVGMAVAFCLVAGYLAGRGFILVAPIRLVAVVAFLIGIPWLVRRATNSDA